MASLSMSRRTLAILLAVILAAVAAVALNSYVQGAESRALKGVETVRAYLAKDTIPEGTSGDTAISKGLIAREAIPSKMLAEGAIKSLTEIKNRVAAVTILKGELILAARFIKPAEAKGILPIPADRQAISVEVGIPPGVAGFIQPGDRVSIVAQLEVAKGADSETRVAYLLQDVQVLSVGQRVVVTTEGKQGAQVQQQQARILMTLALTPPDVEMLTYAVFQGQIYFTLLPPGQKPVGPPGGRTRDNAFA
ncbi:MAG: Flp pilus assembly protein CpaB [Actinomycetota bacterium]